MNDELVKALRVCSSQPCCDNCPRYDIDHEQEPDDCCLHLFEDSADAIERLTEKIEHLQRAYNAVHDDYNMECFAFKFGYLDSAIRDALGIKGGSNEQQP